MKGLQLIFIVLLSISGSFCDQITNPPQDTTVLVGTATVRMTCGAQPENNAVFWTRSVHKDTPSEDVYISFGGSATIHDTDKFETVGDHDLIIKNVGFDDAGRYSCKIVPTNEIKTANLVVTDKPIILNDMNVLAGKSTELHCQVSLQGPRLDEMEDAHIPTLVGFLDDKHMEDVRINVGEGIPGIQTWSIELFSNQTVTQAMDGSVFTCEVRTNTPYFVEATKDALKVKFKVQNIKIHPEREVYDVGQHINCTAEGNPKPEFRWIAVESGGSRPVYNNKLDILESMEGQNTWKCRASNAVDGVPEVLEEEIKFEVAKQVSTDPPKPPGAATAGAGWQIAVGVVVPVVLIAVIVAVVFICRRKKTGKMKTEKNKHGREEEGETDDEDNDENDTLPTKQKPIYNAPGGPQYTYPQTKNGPPPGAPVGGQQVLPPPPEKPIPQSRQGSKPSPQPRTDKPQPQTRPDKEVKFEKDAVAYRDDSNDTTV